MIATQHQPMSMNKARLTILIDQEVKDRFEALCELENRSMSNQTETLIKIFVEQAQREGKLVDRGKV